MDHTRPVHGASASQSRVLIIIDEATILLALPLPTVLQDGARVC